MGKVCNKKISIAGTLEKEKEKYSIIFVFLWPWPDRCDCNIQRVVLVVVGYVRLAVFRYLDTKIYGSRSKGPCKEFYLRKPCVLCWKPSREFFFEFAKEICLFAQVSRKLDIVNHDHCIHYSLLRATISCPPGVRQVNGTAP